MNDLKFAFRQLLKNPGFTAVAVLTLALGIGANTAIFSLVNEVLLESLPVRAPHELVVLRWQGGISPHPNRLEVVNDTFADPVAKNIFSPVAYSRLREHGANAVADLFAFAPLQQINALVDKEPEVVPLSQVVSGNYHHVLGVRAIAGRVLTATDDRPEAEPVAVISYRYWQRRFGGSSAVVGKSVFLNNVAVTIVGVTPPEFSGTLQVGESPDLTVPLVLAPRLRPDRQGRFEPRQTWYWWIRIMGRLQPGATAEQARAQLEPVFRSLALEGKSASAPRAGFTGEASNVGPPRLQVEPGAQGLDEARGGYQRSLLVLTGMAGLVLLSACVNLANLLLARTTRRRKEIAMRLALGASRRRILRQLLTENLLLAVMGAGLGAWMAWWSRDLLLGLQPVARTALVLDLRFDSRVMTFASVIALATSLLFGLVPALRATRLSLNNEIKGGGRNSGPERLRLAKTLVVAQVALSLVLLVGAGLFTRTLRNLQRVELGFNRTHLILFGINGMAAGHDRAQVADLYARMQARLAALPGILGATFSQVPTLGREMVGTGIEIPATAARTEQRVVVPSNGVGPDYFSTLELPLLAGRTFQPMDFTPDAKVVIVNQAFVRRYFGADNALGGRTSAGEIVGVVRDAHYADAREVLGPIAYVPFQHYPMDDGLPGIDAANFVVRTEANPQSVLASLRLVVRAIDPTLALFNVRTLDEQVARLLQQERLFARLSGCFGALAAALVCVGLYGLMSFAVLQRTGEIGIRMALGALPREVLWMVVRESLVLVALGVGFGLAGATAASRLLRTLLFGVEPNDLVTFVAVALLLPSVAVVASWLPARRASNVDPMVALRCE